MKVGHLVNIIVSLVDFINPLLSYCSHLSLDHVVRMISILSKWKVLFTVFISCAELITMELLTLFLSTKCPYNYYYIQIFYYFYNLEIGNLLDTRFFQVVIITDDNCSNKTLYNLSSPEVLTTFKFTYTHYENHDEFDYADVRFNLTLSNSKQIRLISYLKAI